MGKILSFNGNKIILLQQNNQFEKCLIRLAQTWLNLLIRPLDIFPVKFMDEVVRTSIFLSCRSLNIERYLLFTMFMMETIFLI